MPTTTDQPGLDARIDALARQVELRIESGREFLDSLPEFEERTGAQRWRGRNLDNTLRGNARR